MFGAIPCTLYFIAYFNQALLIVAHLSTFILFAIVFYETVQLFRTKAINAYRVLPGKLSNGDPNDVKIYLENKSSLDFNLKVIDEVPAQFQFRDNYFNAEIPKNSSRWLTYQLNPTKRGTYKFGQLRLFASLFFHLVERRYNEGEPAEMQSISLYHPYEGSRTQSLFQKISNGWQQNWSRRVGESMEFDQIRNYSLGDDIRKINWKATARKNELMVNQNMQEKSQPIYAIIDKGRLLKMPFNGMSLLDYSINASLAFANIGLKKDDKVGLLTFNTQIDQFIKADRSLKQLKLIMEALYSQETKFLESDYSMLYSFIRRNISTRSFLMLYTNFETMDSLRRQIIYLRQIARLHLLVVVIFENTELTGPNERNRTDYGTNLRSNCRGKIHPRKKANHQGIKKSIVSMLFMHRPS